MRIATVLLLVWLLIGAIACGQRDYFSNASENCADFGTIALTVIAGPLNYIGANPQVTDCELPQPSP
ncbi:hypothetical protein [Antrihabitans sp. YC2-6]|uniref:hypothetical protein n=1 Tax=Antrihabitans sp. YC2-6 TaxID=2799498 RepID=UPI001F3E89D7|nr:hypothetical protein [Antrihabitans sp. YC2-6]